MPPAATDARGLRVPVKAGVERGRPLTFTLDGETIAAFEGETIAAALMAAGRRVLRLTQVEGRPRGVFCGMGACFDCLVVVDGAPSRRACPYRRISGDFNVSSAEPGRRTTTMGSSRASTAQSFQRPKPARLSLPISQTKRVRGKRRRSARTVSTV